MRALAISTIKTTNGHIEVGFGTVLVSNDTSNGLDLGRKVPVDGSYDLCNILFMFFHNDGLLVVESQNKDLTSNIGFKVGSDEFEDLGELIHQFHNEISVTIMADIS